MFINVTINEWTLPEEKSFYRIVIIIMKWMIWKREKEALMI